MNGGVAEIDGVFELVKPILKHSEPKQETDQNHQHNHARAQHAHLASTATHLLLLMMMITQSLIYRDTESKRLFLFLFFFFVIVSGFFVLGSGFLRREMNLLVCMYVWDFVRECEGKRVVVSLKKGKENW